MAKDNGKNSKKKESNLFKDLREKIETESVNLKKIPSILEFVENKTFLGLPYKLFDLQRLVLKCFYRGSLGNENLKLTKEDIDLINKNNLNHIDNGNMIDKWQSNHDFRELVLVWGRRCLSEDVEIVDHTTGKIWTLGEMWNFGKTEIGAWTFDERSGKMIYMPQSNLVYQGKKEVNKVFLTSGHEIEATEDHPILTEKGWLQIKDLQVKDKVAIASHNPVFGTSEFFTEEQASILGYMSSSCFDSTGDFIASIYKEGIVYEDFKKCAKNVSAFMHAEERNKYRIQTYDNRQYLSIFSETTENNAVKVVDRLLIENGLKNKMLTQKFVPSRIFQSKKNIIISYLRSLFTCSSKINTKKSTRFTCKIEIQFENKKIARQIQHLLSRFGIFANITQIGAGNDSKFNVSISKNSHVLRFLQQIGIYTHADEIQDVYANVKAEAITDQPLYSTVESVVKIGFKRTFDIQVSDFSHLQNFVANGLISHNCIAEDAELIDARTGEKFTFKQAWQQEKTISSWTYDQDKKSMVIVDDCVVLSQGRRIVYKITSVEGKEIEVTDNHPFLTQRGWVECRDLQDGDRLVFSKASENAETRQIYYADFVSKQLIGEKETFDLQVSDNPSLQNFCCNGFVVHNSGKDFLCSIIALYEAMRLLEMPGGDPYKIYNLGSATPFTILTIANSSSQAKILFREIKDKVLQSEYFRDKILPEGVTADGIHFLTPEDKRRNEELTEKGFAPNLGSIVVRSGHSNSDTLVGISCYVLLLDEIGLYKNTAGSSSGDAIFNSLAPAVKTYVREVPKIDNDGKPILDDNGQQITDKIYDGKIICLSTPRGKEGIFYDLYNNHQEVHHRLVCRAATWQVNPMQSKEALMAAFPSMPEEKFRMEFGAEFSGTAGENFFPEEAVEDCFQDKNLKLREYGKPGVYHFAHLDPATSSHNYALVMAHKETFFDRDTGKRDWKIIVDHIKYWSPSPGKPILVEEVDDYVIELNSKFCIGVVTYDHFNSHASIEKLRKKGVPTKMTPFTKRYKNIIFDYLYQLVIQRKLHIPQHLLLRNEMKNLQRKWLNSGYKVYPKRDGDVTTDDIVDALAGACFNCVEKEMTRMPQGKLVNLPVQGNNNIVWRSMQGVPYGIGSGGQVARQMENRTPNPRRGV